VSLVVITAGCSGGSDSPASSGKGAGGGVSSDVTFADPIYPLFEANCADCHITKIRGELSLADLDGVYEGGESGDAVIPGNAEGSLLYQLVTTTDPDERMPRKADALSASDIALIKTWIDSGAY
jgi:hypothetical protein